MAGATLLDALELAQELRNRGGTLRRVPRRENAGPAVERRHLEARVLRENPARCVLTPESCLDSRVLVVGRAGLGRVVVTLQRLDRPARQEPFQLACLVRIPRAEHGSHSIQRTSRTPSISATPATTAGAEPAASWRSTAIERRSPSCATSSETTRPPFRSIASMTGT